MVIAKVRAGEVLEGGPWAILQRPRETTNPHPACRDSGVWAYFVVTREMGTNCYVQGGTRVWVVPVV